MSSERNINWQPINRHDQPVSGSVALRIYADTAPHNLKIADLQKGLVLVHRGLEKVGEGLGFGVPILICGDETYFSATSDLYLHRREDVAVLKKVFYMDRIARNTFRNLKLENKKIRAALRYLSGMYQRHSRLRVPMLELKRAPLKMGFSTVFMETRSKGRIIVTYRIKGNHIHIAADLGNLTVNDIGRIFIMNEQGASFLTRYRDSNGATLIKQKIDAWNVVDAEWASMTDAHGDVGFRVKRTRDSILRRGREIQQGVLEWAGLDYEITSRSDSFEYEIEILGADLPA
jgi:hypothetical protein